MYFKLLFKICLTWRFDQLNLMHKGVNSPTARVYVPLPAGIILTAFFYSNTKFNKLLKLIKIKEGYDI